MTSFPRKDQGLTSYPLGEFRSKLEDWIYANPKGKDFLKSKSNKTFKTMRRNPNPKNRKLGVSTMETRNLRKMEALYP